MSERIAANKTHLLITISVFLITIFGSALWFLGVPVVTKGDTEGKIENTTVTNSHELEGKHVVVRLDSMLLELHDGSAIIGSYPLISQGKPGSYYETIGGMHVNDYKVPLHFSSIGHVYMPYSVHVFGNYFIHGIPYYPNGNQVSSEYSGGCIRLSNEDAKIVYNFIDRGTPIIITRDTEHSFNQTPLSSSPFTSITMTNLMIASISLEALTQDSNIVGPDGRVTTRKKLLPKLLTEGDVSVARLYTQSIGEKAFIDLMNQKAQALGLRNTHFSALTSPVSTTYEDYERFMNYISTYKSYLLTIQ